MSNKKGTLKFKKKFTRVDETLFNYQYIKSKEEKKEILFVYDKETPFRVTKKNKQWWMNKFISDKYINKPKKPTNILEVSFKEIRFDGDEIIEENNKKIIKSILKKILDTAKDKDYKKVGIPSKGLGLNLKDKAPKSYEYLKQKIRENEVNKLYSQSEKSVIEIKNKKGKTKRVYRGSNSISKNNKKAIKKATKKMKKVVSKAESNCAACRKGFALVKRPLFTKKSNEASNYVKMLEDTEKKCKKCHSKCMKIKELISGVEEKEKVLADYPNICKTESTNRKNKAQRLKIDLYNKIIQQKNKLNEEDDE